MKKQTLGKASREIEPTSVGFARLASEEGKQSVQTFEGIGKDVREMPLLPASTG